MPEDAGRYGHATTSRALAAALLIVAASTINYPAMSLGSAVSDRDPPIGDFFPKNQKRFDQTPQLGGPKPAALPTLELSGAYQAKYLVREAANQDAFDVCYALDSGVKADVVGGPSRARTAFRSMPALLRFITWQDSTSRRSRAPVRRLKDRSLELRGGVLEPVPK